MTQQRSVFTCYLNYIARGDEISVDKQRERDFPPRWEGISVLIFIGVRPNLAEQNCTD